MYSSYFVTTVHAIWAHRTQKITLWQKYSNSNKLICMWWLTVSLQAIWWRICMSMGAVINSFSHLADLGLYLALKCWWCRGLVFFTDVWIGRAMCTSNMFLRKVTWGLATCEEQLTTQLEIIPCSSMYCQHSSVVQSWHGDTCILINFDWRRPNHHNS